MEHQDFREKLESIHKWPSEYMFKFIIPAEKKQELIDILGEEGIEIKESGKGNYISVTSKKMISNSDEVIDIYEKVYKIEGIISL